MRHFYQTAVALVWLLFSQHSLAESTCTYNSPSASLSNNTLTIPMVSSNDPVAGFYPEAGFEDVTLKLNEQGGLSVQIYAFSRFLGGISAAKALITDTFPVQVFLNIKGKRGCQRIGKINTNFTNNSFNVNVNLANPRVYVSCLAVTDGSDIFETNIPLMVYGLSAGTYQYSINNGLFTGSFVLSKDNLLPKVN